MAAALSGGQVSGITAARVVEIGLCHGLVIAVLVGAIGSISGGHINPSITLAFVITGRLSVIRGIMYFCAQIAGAIVGAGFTYAVVTDVPHVSFIGHSNVAAAAMLLVSD